MKKIKLIVIFLLSTLTTFSQENKNTLLTIGNNKISSDEFLYIYKKNNADNISKESLDEYLKLFTDFKLKVIEAENLKMDTSEAFKKELNGYKKQLAKPYLTENKKWKELVDQAVKRENTELKLDIIFTKLPREASPEDTLKAYNKSLEIRKRLINGENFDSVAVETSDDRAVKNNKGHLSYLKPLRIPYRIQNFAFNAKKGDLSMPLKTDFGYYLVRLADTRPAQGYVKVAHIMISSGEAEKDSIKNIKKAKADSIYTRLIEGDKFEDLLELSDDKASAKKGGELPEFTTGRMVPEFEQAAFSLKNPGDITKPVKTRFGWHIIKLISKRPPDNPETRREKIEKTIKNDRERKEIVKEYAIKKLKEKYNFKEINSPETIISLLDSSVFEGKWKMPVTKRPSKELFTVNQKKYYDKDFAIFIEKKQKRTKDKDFKKLVKEYYEDYVYKILSDTETENLEKTEHEFKYLLKEYHDGMLLFDLMKKQIWDKASEDSIGLKKFYNDNYDSLYNKQISYDITVYKYQKTKDAKKAIKLLSKYPEKYKDTLLTEKINKGDTARFLIIEKGEFAKGENIYADKIFSQKNPELKKIYNFPKDKILIYVKAKKISKGKNFDEIKGIVISDYQNHLEKKMLEKLRKKYKTEINENELKKIKSQLKKNK